MEKALIYFDNAATVWPKPENVYRFMDEFYRTHGVNPGRSGYDLAIEAGFTARPPAQAHDEILWWR